MKTFKRCVIDKDGLYWRDESGGCQHDEIKKHFPGVFQSHKINRLQTRADFFYSEGR